MVDKRISELTPLTAADIASNDVFIIVDSSVGDDKSVTVEEASARLAQTGVIAANVPFTPVGTIAGDDVQEAVAEVATDAIARELAISQSLQTTSLYALSIAQSLNTTSTFLSLTSNALTVDIANLAGHIASTTVVHGIADTATLLRTGSIGVTVQAYNANYATTGQITVTTGTITNLLLGTASKSASTDFLPVLQSIRSVTTTNYTMVLGDINNIIEMNTGGANQVVIPVGLTASTGVRVDIIQYGAGATTVASDNTSTIHVRTGLTRVLKGKYAVTTFYHHGSDEWIGGGDLT